MAFGISSVFLLFGLVGLLGNAIGAYSIDRWGAVRTIVPCVIMVGLAFLTLSLALLRFLPLLWRICHVEHSRNNDIACPAASFDRRYRRRGRAWSSRSIVPRSTLALPGGRPWVV